MKPLPSLLAFLLLCSSAFAADPSTGPVFGIWHIDGHGYQWQLDQINSGLPMEPCIRMAAREGLNTVKGNGTAMNLDVQGPLLSQFDGRSVVLRMNNIRTEVDKTIPRFALTEDNWRDSFLAIYRKPDGSLDDQQRVSPWGAKEPWARAGQQWAQSVWMRRLCELIPNPTGVILLENAEGYDVASFYVKSDGARIRLPDGRVVWANIQNTPDQFVDVTGTPYGAEWLWRVEPDVRDGGQLKWNGYRWRSDDELDGRDLRAKDWVSPHRAAGHFPPDVYGEITTALRERYDWLYAAFDANLSDGWRGKLRTVGYHEWDGLHDAGSSQTYTAYSASPANGPTLTEPAYLQVLKGRRERFDALDANPKSWREISVNMGAGSVNAGVTAESFAGFCAFYAWGMQHAGREVRIRYWDGYTTIPSQPISSKSPLTVGEVETAILQRLGEIRTHSTLRKHWEQGVTTLLESDQNDATVTRVYAAVNEIPGEPRNLLIVYSPTSLPEIHAGEHVLPYQQFAYYLTNPLEPLPAPELTLEQRVERLEHAVFGE